VSKEDTEKMGSQVCGNEFIAKPIKAQEIIEIIDNKLG
jgi:hypothetical protein